MDPILWTVATYVVHSERGYVLDIYAKLFLVFLKKSAEFSFAGFAVQ